jgi:hypothetical protein
VAAGCEVGEKRCWYEIFLWLKALKKVRTWSKDYLLSLASGLFILFSK